MSRYSNNDELYLVDARDLQEISLLLNTGYPDDWINIFYHDAKKGVTISQFNDEMDLTDDRLIRINSKLAIKIWRMVEASDIKKVMLNEIEGSKRFSEEHD